MVSHYKIVYYTREKTLDFSSRCFVSLSRKMASLNETERIEILMMIGYGDRTRSFTEVVNLFNELHPDRDLISKSTVSKTLSRFRETGSVKDRPKVGRPVTATSEENSLNVILDVMENPTTSTQQLALTHDISRYSIQKIVKRERFRPYKIHLLQELGEDDFDRRIEFCEVIMDNLGRNLNFVNNILFSDECTFCLNGEVNRHNCRYWSDENPHWMEQVHTQRPQKVNVWCGIIGGHIIGPYLINGNLNSARYLALLQESIVPDLIRLFPNDNDPNLVAEHIWFQQDGAPPHFGIEVREFLNQTFPGRWIGRRGTIEWPARSPDLNPLDFFLWGHTKNLIYKNRPQNVEELQARILHEIQNISQNAIVNTLQNFVHRIHYCQEVNGEHFEHLIK